MTDSPTFRIVTLPKPKDRANPDPTTIALAEKFRELRLRSLQVASDAFASTYETESQRGLDQTLDRMTNPKAVQFVAVNRPNGNASFKGDNDVSRILSSDWIGLIVLLGPVEDNPAEGNPKRDPFQRMTAADRENKLLGSGGLATSPSALHYHLNAMFVDPLVRGGGLGRALVQAALQWAESESSRLSAGLRITINVYKHNVAARKLYEKVGFKVVEERPSLTREDGSIAVDMELTMAADP